MSGQHSVVSQRCSGPSQIQPSHNSEQDVQACILSQCGVVVAYVLQNAEAVQLL